LGIKDMSKIDSSHIQSYLEKRLQDGISYSSWRKEASHANKFGEALRRFDGQDRNFAQAINDLRSIAKDSLATSNKDHGGFNRPQDVISKLAEKNEKYELAARVQCESGARLREATLIKQDQLKGLQRDELTGKQVGVVHLTDTKGGKPRDVQVSPDTYKRLENATRNEAFKVNEGSYRNAVSEAAKATQEPRTGTHDFRYNYAQGRVNEIIQSGYSGEQAIQQTSWEMGHERADITNLYLR
jgi:integrase